jgi:hypothetical protein
MDFLYNCQGEIIMRLKPNTDKDLWIAANKNGKFFVTVSNSYETVKEALCNHNGDPRIRKDWQDRILSESEITEKWWKILRSEGWDIVKVASIYTDVESLTFEQIMYQLEDNKIIFEDDYLGGNMETLVIIQDLLKAKLAKER